MSTTTEKQKDPIPPEDELSELTARLAALEATIAGQEKELEARQKRNSELEQTLAERESDIEGLKQSMVESSQREKQLTESLGKAAAVYRTLVLNANPQVPEELVSGDSIEAIDESLARANNLVSKVKQGLEAEAISARVPAGAPPRTPPDFSGLTPREKIQYAIGDK